MMIQFSHKIIIPVRMSASCVLVLLYMCTPSASCVLVLLCMSTPLHPVVWCCSTRVLWVNPLFWCCSSCAFQVHPVFWCYSACVLQVHPVFMCCFAFAFQVIFENKIETFWCRSLMSRVISLHSKISGNFMFFQVVVVSIYSYSHLHWRSFNNLTDRSHENIALCC